MSAETAVWRSVPRERLIWTSWGEDFIVFHRPSGITHFLNAASHYLVDDFLRQPRTVADVGAEMLALTGGENEPATVRRHMHSLLSRLEEIGLVERV